MTDTKSMNESELRTIVLSQSEAIIRLIRQLQTSEIQKKPLDDKDTSEHRLDAFRYMTLTMDAKRSSKDWTPLSECASPASGKRVLVKLANNHVAIATCYFAGIYKGISMRAWKNDSGCALEDDDVKFWKELDE